MASLNDITEAIDCLKLSAIDVKDDRCVAVRNRNSKCKKCQEACIADAIIVSNNELKIDDQLCVNCGSCIAVCPTKALFAKEPTEKSVLNSLKDKASKSATVLIVCARRASKKEVDDTAFVEVPCLAHLNELELLEAMAIGAKDIILVDGNCETCKYGLANAAIDETVEQASRLVDLTNADAIMTRVSEFPEFVERLKAGTNRGKDRRGLFRQTGGYMRGVASNVVEKTMENNILLGNSDKTSLKDKIIESATGKFKSFEPTQNYGIIDSLEKLDIRNDAVQNESIDTRHFGKVEIDYEKCSGCGMCVLFCPTKALRYNEFDTPEDDTKRYIEFYASDCTQCMLCKDVCIKRCLDVKSRVKVKEVLDFEPENLLISKPLNRNTIEALIDKSQA